MTANPYRKPIAGSYKLLLRRLPPFDTLSVRKRLCLTFLKWKVWELFEDKEKLVDLAKEFRALPGRRGSNRTIVEKEARKFFREVKKHRGLEVSRKAAREYAKGQRDRGEGIHSAEELEKKKERWQEVLRKQAASRNHPFAKEWIITDPEGNEFRIKGLGTWARDHGFNNCDIYKTANRPWKCAAHKGYKARHFDPVNDAHIPWDEDYKPKDWDSV